MNYRLTGRRGVKDPQDVYNCRLFKRLSTTRSQSHFEVVELVYELITYQFPSCKLMKNKVLSNFSMKLSISHELNRCMINTQISATTLRRNYDRIIDKPLEYALSVPCPR